MKKLTCIGMGAVLVVTLMLTAIIVLRQAIPKIIFGNNSAPIEFSKEAWDQYPEDRGPMVKDLLEKYEFTSMTKDEVIDLLGQKRFEEYPFEKKINSGFLNYETGGGFLSDEILVFEFDGTGKIIDVGLAN